MKHTSETPHVVIDDSGDVRLPDDLGYFDAVGTTPRTADYSRDQADISERQQAYESDGLDAMLHLAAERDAAENGTRTPEGVSVNLGERAVALLKSVASYAEYNSRRSYVHVLEAQLRSPKVSPSERAVINRKIKTAKENMAALEAAGREAFNAGYGLDAMREHPESFTDEDGFSLTEQDIIDLGIPARRAFRSEFTAYDIRDDQTTDPNDQLYDIGQRRTALRRTLERQKPTER